MAIGKTQKESENAVSVEKVTIVVNRCVCKLPDCIGKGRPWESDDENIPKRCRWCKRSSWNGQDLRYNNAPHPAGSVEKVTKTRYRCVCELPDCLGQGQPWFSKDEKIPARCRWCKRISWNGRQDLRRKNAQSTLMRVRVCKRCSGIEWALDANGVEVCVRCAGLAPTPGASRLELPKPAEKNTSHAPGCKCTLCQIKHGKTPAVGPTKGIALPKPRKVRNPE
jgi:hypothetical protein